MEFYSRTHRRRKCFHTLPIIPKKVDHLAGSRKKAERRTRRDRLKKHVEGFERQMSPPVDTYLKWRAELGDASLELAAPPPPASEGPGRRKIKVVDVFRKF